MIDPDKRNAVFQLHEAGMPLREISRRLRISRNTVRSIIRNEGRMPRTVRRDKIHIDPDLLPRAYFGSGFEARAFRTLRVYLAWPKTRERPISVDVVGKNESGDAKLWVGGRLQHERPSITVRAELIWSDFKQEYVLRSGVD